MIHTVLVKVNHCNDHTKIKNFSMGINNNKLITYTIYLYSLKIRFSGKITESFR